MQIEPLRACDHFPLLGFGPDGWSFLGERTTSAALILGALFGGGLVTWPRRELARA